jgi:hypothetical protein
MLASLETIAQVSLIQDPSYGSAFNCSEEARCRRSSAVKNWPTAASDSLDQRGQGN